MKYLFYFSTLFILLLGCCTEKKPSKERGEVSFLRHVGDIPFNPDLDDVNFKLCNEKHAQQYYAFGNSIHYKGEKGTLIREFQQKYTLKGVKDSGYITIRFIVNCQGETGRFRVIEMDKDYKETSLNPQIAKQLLQITQGLEGWKIAESDGNVFDYYQYLTFKITNGKIEHILP